MSLYNDATQTKTELLAARAVLRDNLLANGIVMPETATLMELAAAFNQAQVDTQAMVGHNADAGAHAARFAAKADLVDTTFNTAQSKRLNPAQAPIVVRSEAVIMNIEPNGNGEIVFYDVSGSMANEVMIDPVMMDMQDNYAKFVVTGMSMGATQKEIRFYGNVKQVYTNGFDGWLASSKAIMVEIFAFKHAAGVMPTIEYLAVVTQFS